MRPNFSGLEVYGNDDCIVDIPAGGDELIILRQTESYCNATIRGGGAPAKMNDEEMVDKARNCRTKQITPFLKMAQFEAPGGKCCLLFQNTGDSQVGIKFDFQLSNARVKNWENISEGLFIPPDEEGYVYIEPIEEGQNMSMRFSMKIELR